MNKIINASVHDIVDFVYAKGDIVPAFVEKNNMRDGMITHTEVQKQYPDEQKEFFVKLKVDFLEYTINLQGRIDILEKVINDFHVIEIKSTYSLDNLEINLAHLAQAKFYAYMLYHTINIDKTTLITVSILYVNKFNFEKKFFTYKYSYYELEQFFYETMQKYLDFISIIDNYKDLKLNSINSLNFPYHKIRIGQEKLISEVYNLINRNENLFVCAPTGIGKSLGTIYPALKATKNKEEQIFYLTAKSMLKNVARSAINILREKSGLKCKSLTITAKEKVCINDVFKCNPIDCVYAKDFFTKLSNAISDIYQNEDDINYEIIIIYAKKHLVCPFEFQLALSLYMDIIICDYNYVFDNRVYLRRFFDVPNKNIVLLIDEAHNMYDRVTNMYSQSINITLFENILKMTDNNKDITKTINSLITKLSQYQNILFKENKNNYKYENIDETIINDLFVLLNKLENFFENKRKSEIEINEELLLLYFDLNNFLKIAEFFDKDFIIWTQLKAKDIDYSICCLNPRNIIRMRTNNLKSSIFFSATLHPMDYFIYLLGGNENSNSLILNSPFEQTNLNLLINNNISTKYNDREFTKYQIANQIDIITKNGGKYIAYFPSYQYLEMVHQAFLKLSTNNFEIIKQEKDMTEIERFKFIDKFDETIKNIIGFAVLGGSFAEGIDLKGDKLNGVIIVGVGLPTFDDFRNELRNYFDKQNQKGYQYAYIYPGFNKVLQAVGRVIRSEDDKGLALLIDERYLTYEYLKLFPKYWSHYQKI